MCRRLHADWNEANHEEITGVDDLGNVAQLQHGLSHRRMLARVLVRSLPPAANRGGCRTVHGDRVVQPLRQLRYVQSLRYVQQSLRYVWQPVRYVQQSVWLTLQYLPDDHAGDRARSRGRPALSSAEGRGCCRPGRYPQPWRHASRQIRVHRASAVCS